MNLGWLNVLPLVAFIFVLSLPFQTAFNQFFYPSTESIYKSDNSQFIMKTTEMSHSIVTASTLRPKPRFLDPVTQGFIEAFESAGMKFLKDKESNITEPKSEDYVKFFLYTTSSNLDNGLRIRVDDDFERNGFIHGAPVKIICHGLFGSYNAMGPGRLLLPGILAYIGPHKPAVNVILIDWSKHAGLYTIEEEIPTIGFQGIYFIAARQAETVANLTARLVLNLFSNHQKGQVGFPLNKIHLIGHSIAAHAMGLAGKFIQEQNLGGKIQRITGLDPSGPCYEKDPYGTCIKYNYRPLSKTDANFVDIIHTETGLYGFSAPMGHVDFYPNGGIHQPGCRTILFDQCSHDRSNELMAATIDANRSDFVAKKCPRWDDFLLHKCSANDSVKMGEFTPHTARGNYYLKTTGSAPFTALY